MNIAQNIENIKNIIMQPTGAWENLDADKLNIKSFFLIHVLGVLSLVFLGRFVGKSLEILSISSIYYIASYAFFSLICEFLSFYLSVLVINKLLPSYNVPENFRKICLLLYYSLIPYYFIAFVINLFPSMYFLGIICLYGPVLFWFGTKSLFNFKKEDHLIFYIISIIIIAGIHLTLRFIVILPFFNNIIKL